MRRGVISILFPQLNSYARKSVVLFTSFFVSAQPADWLSGRTRTEHGVNGRIESGSQSSPRYGGVHPTGAADGITR